jgi:hypothetical protein
MENKFFYSPQENHLAIVYSDLLGNARFKRFIDETECVWLGPKVLTQQYVLKEHYLGPRTAHIFLSNVLTVDRIHLELELKVFYRVDPRKTAPENLIQVLNMPDAAFESIIKTNTEEKVRNDVFIRFTEDELFDPRGRKRLRTELSHRISERVSGFGISINPQFGVAVMNIQPNALYLRALQEESAAASQGNAAYKRVAPTLQNMELEEALQVLYTHLASTMTKTGNIPSTLFTAQPPANAAQNIIEKEADEQKKRRDYKYPLAAD